MDRLEIIETIDRKRRILLSRGGSLSHRRILLISQQIDSLNATLKEIDNGFR